MARVRFIAFALMVAMMLISVGFAKTQDITVGATVDTGVLQVDMVSTAIEHDGYITSQKSVSADGRAVTFTVDGLYPGAHFATHVKAINQGNLLVAFDNATLTWEGNLALQPYLEVLGGFQYNGDGDGDVDGGDKIQPSWANLDTIVTALNNSAPLHNMVLRSGGAFYLGNPMDGVQGSFDYPLIVRLSPDAPDEIQNTSATFKLTLNWRQAEFDLWSGKVEVRWRKVLDDRKGWLTFGDVYLIYQDGTSSRDPYMKDAVSKYFSGPEDVNHLPDNFKVEVGGIINNYQVDVPKEHPAAPVVVEPK